MYEAYLQAKGDREETAAEVEVLRGAATDDDDDDLVVDAFVVILSLVGELIFYSIAIVALVYVDLDCIEGVAFLTGVVFAEVSLTYSNANSF